MKGRLFISGHPLVLDKISRLRDSRTSMVDFRRLMAEVSILLGYEALTGLRLRKASVKTPLGRAACMKAGREITFATILRAGLGMTDGLLQLEPRARLGHIGIYRNEETLDPVRYYVKFPKKLKEHYVVLVDPMLATGGSAAEAVGILKSRGASDITFMCILAARQGISNLHKQHPEVPIYAGAVDNVLNKNGYIVPGLGDAGDRMFGTF